MKHGKNYENAAKKIEAGKQYEVADALALAIETATAKFDETIEIHIRLGVDPRSADQQVRGSVVLPNGTGKTSRVLVITKGDKADAAKAAGADVVGAEEIVDKIIKDGWLEFDTCITTPDILRRAGDAHLHAQRHAGLLLPDRLRQRAKPDAQRGAAGAASARGLQPA